MWAFLGAQMGKNLPAMQETRLDPWVGKIPWRRAWQHAPVFFPGESHGQRSLVGYGPQRSQRVGQDWETNTFTFLVDLKSYDSFRWKQWSKLSHFRGFSLIVGLEDVFGMKETRVYVLVLPIPNRVILELQDLGKPQFSYLCFPHNMTSLFLFLIKMWQST